MKHFNIQIHDLHNVLKYIRNNTNMSSLKLNKKNIIDGINNIYKNNYLK